MTVTPEFISEMKSRRADLRREARAVLDRASNAGREFLNDFENRQFQRLTRDMKGLNARIADAESEMERAGKALLTARGGRALATRAQARAVAPLTFDTNQLKLFHRAAQSGEPRRIESRAFNSADSLLPAQLWQSVIGPQHDNRILDHLPVFPTELPVVSYIRHTATTGSPGIVAEGALKPELVFTVDNVLAPVKKLAAHAGVSHEIIADWSVFFDYVQTELAAQVVDVENNEILNSGLGTTPTGFTGFLGTSGILTHTRSSETPLDAIEISIAKLRTGAAKATGNLLVLHPNTWSAVRRTKDGQDRYLTAPDPTAGEASTVWGVPVLTTTQIAAGTGLLLDTSKFGRVHVRQPLMLMTGYTQDDFTRNILRIIAEERLTLAVERPAAVLAISNLPAS